MRSITSARLVALVWAAAGGGGRSSGLPAQPQHNFVGAARHPATRPSLDVPVTIILPRVTAVRSRLCDLRRSLPRNPGLPHKPAAAIHALLHAKVSAARQCSRSSRFGFRELAAAGGEQHRWVTDAT
jgi:hypothetical protein